MPRWKASATEFTVSVTYHKTRGYQLYVPRPVIERLSNPVRVTFIIHRQRVEIRAASGVSVES